MDWFVILGPLLILGIVALLGFAGCSFTPGKLLTANVTLRIRVPTSINVGRAGFRLDAPSEPAVSVAADPPTATAGFNVYQHRPTDPETGTWQVTAVVRAGGAGSPVDAEAMQDLMFVGDGAEWVALFEASGDPAQGTFKVEFVSFLPQV